MSSNSMLRMIIITALMLICGHLYARPMHGTGGAPASLCPDPGVGYANILNADGNYLTNADGNCIAAKI